MGIHDALILGLDPGRDKIGFAAVALTKELLFSGVFPAKELGAFLEKVGRESCSAGTFSPWLRECLEEGTRRAPRAVVLGDGTCCHVLMKALKAASLPCRVVCVGEGALLAAAPSPSLAASSAALDEGASAAAGRPGSVGDRHSRGGCDDNSVLSINWGFKEHAGQPFARRGQF